MDKTTSKIDISYSIDLVPNPNDFVMHAHDHLEIYYFLRGKAHYRVEGNLYTLQPHDILIMRAGETHKLEIDEALPYERIAIHLCSTVFTSESSLLNPFFRRSIGKNNKFSRNDFESQHYISCMNEMKKLNAQSEFIYKKSLVMSVLCEISKVYKSSNLISVQVGPNEELAIRMVNFVNENLFNEISLDLVAKHFYISRSQVNRIFAKATGSTLWDYVIIKRLIAARELIKSGVTASKASLDCGFKDYSAFYKAYKSRYNNTPKEDYKNFSLNETN